MQHLTTHQIAAWRWVWTELGEDEPLNVDAVIAVCERGKRRDDLHRRWAETVMRDLIGEEER